jgi:MbtH protein
MRISQGNGDSTLYKVLVDPQEQCSIWPAGRAAPAGWREAGKTGSKTECLAYIRELRSPRRPAAPVAATAMSLGVPARDPEAGPDRGGCPV